MLTPKVTQLTRGSAHATTIAITASPSRRPVKPRGTIGRPTTKGPAKRALSHASVRCSTSGPTVVRKASELRLLSTVGDSRLGCKGSSDGLTARIHATEQRPWRAVVAPVLSLGGSIRRRGPSPAPLQAVEREHSHAVGVSRDLADRAGPRPGRSAVSSEHFDVLVAEPAPRVSVPPVRQSGTPQDVTATRRDRHGSQCRNHAWLRHSLPRASSSAGWGESRVLLRAKRNSERLARQRRRPRRKWQPSGSP
jgi:hypothetical protein